MTCACGGKCGGHTGKTSEKLSSTGSEKAQQHAYANVLADNAATQLLVLQHKELVRHSHQLFDASRPVDEYMPLNSYSGEVAPLVSQWQPDYALACRIESVLVSIPVGVTSASLQLGSRQIPLYSGAATTVQTIINLQDLGMIIGESDNRILTFTGAPTTGYYIGLAGYVLERSGTR